MNVSFSNDNVTFFSAESQNLAQATGASNYAGATNAFGSTVEARYVKFDVDSSHGSNNGFTGLSEVRFNTVTTEIEPTNVSVNQDANGGASFGIENLTNNDGMQGAGLEQAIPAASGNSFDGMWRQQDNGTTVNIEDSQITFDFGSVQDIGSIKIWNYAEDGLNDRGISAIEIFESEDGINFDSLGDFNLTESPDGLHTQHDVIDLAAIDAQFIRFDVLDQVAGNNEFFGLNEVRFFAPVASALPVPEPGSIAIWLLLGLIGLGLGLKKRLRRSA